MNIAVNWADPAVQAAAIQAAGQVLAALIAAVIAGFIGRQFANRKRLEERLTIALGDILFLLATEQEHCARNTVTTPEAAKRRVRQAVAERGLVWSGRHTTSRVKNALVKASSNNTS